jgi:hypothetical protein
MEAIPPEGPATQISLPSLEYGSQSPLRSVPKRSLFLGLAATAFSIIGALRMIAGRTTYNATHLPRWHFTVVSWLATQLEPFWQMIFLAVPCICLAGILMGIVGLKRENLDRRWALVGIVLSLSNLIGMFAVLARL